MPTATAPAWITGRRTRAFHHAAAPLSSSGLAQGRKSPNAYIGYVFLYFYGLERRLLHDHRNGAADQDERRAIFNEVKRLLKLYGDNRSFARYAQGFLYTIYLGQGDRDLTQSPPLRVHSGNDIPPPLKVGLGQFSKAGNPDPG
ncbi:MAG: TerB N-terminal domain-containing protein [Halofilum sp. (in: g-proteobacteria)]|nr:TerB N-terminal domain-containing protein [Halofilum sp. (in: g-proteobacteria)]